MCRSNVRAEKRIFSHRSQCKLGPAFPCFTAVARCTDRREIRDPHTPYTASATIRNVGRAPVAITSSKSSRTSGCICATAIQSFNKINKIYPFFYIDIKTKVQIKDSRHNSLRENPKGLVINYGEGGATKWENRGSETFCAPPLKTG